MKKIVFFSLFFYFFLYFLFQTTDTVFALNCTERSDTAVICPSECGILVHSSTEAKYFCSYCNRVSFDPNTTSIVCPSTCPIKFGPGTDYPYGNYISCLDEQELNKILLLIPSPTTASSAQPTTIPPTQPNTTPPTSQPIPTNTNQGSGINIGSSYLFKQTGVASIFTSLSVLLNIFVKNVFVIAGIIFLILLIISGIGVIVSAGGGNPEGAKKAKAAATSAAIGLALVFCSYWIIQIVQYITGINIFNPGI